MGQQINNFEATGEAVFLSHHTLSAKPADSDSSQLIKTLNLPVKLLAKKPAWQQVDAGINDSWAQKEANFFDALNDDVLNSLLDSAKLQPSKQNELIVEHGDQIDFIYYLLDGQVSVCRSAVDGRDMPICLLETGDTFMESVIFMAGVSPFSVKAMTPCQLLKIPVSVVKQQAALDGQLRTNILRIAAQRQKHAIQHIDNLITKDAIDRLGYYFLKQRLQHNPESLKININTRKTVIASHLGMKPETFSRAVKKLRTTGINVSADKRFIIKLRDNSVLCNYCDADTAANCTRSGTVRCKRQFSKVSKSALI